MTNRFIQIILSSIFTCTVLMAIANSAIAKEIPESIKTLATSTSLQTEVLNQATKSKIFAAYKSTRELNLKPNGEEINWLIKNGSPSGKVYGAFLSWEGDFNSGRSRFEKLKDDQSKVIYRNGCTGEETTVAAIAREFLSKDQFKDFPTSRFCERPIAMQNNSKKYLHILKTAPRLTTEQTGEGGEVSPQYKAFIEAAKQGPRIKNELIDLIENASPAGKLYAATLLYGIDNKLGLEKLKQLSSCQNKIEFQSGCEVAIDTVANVALALSQNGRYLTWTLAAK